eukprot:6194265-Amphidinium_carterae.1
MISAWHVLKHSAQVTSTHHVTCLRLVRKTVPFGNAVATICRNITSQECILQQQEHTPVFELSRTKIVREPTSIIFEYNPHRQAKLRSDDENPKASCSHVPDT